MDYKEQLKELITFSSLDLGQKNLWYLFLKVSYTEEDEAVFEAISESDSNLELLTAHLKDKLRDMKDTNPDAWDVLKENEKKFAELF